jgi:hypothetical protein
VILAVRRHWLPVTACKRAIVIPYIADAPIDIREGCPLFPSVGKTALSAVFHSCVGAATAIRSLWLRLGMGGLQEHRAGDQERCKRTDRGCSLTVSNLGVQGHTRRLFLPRSYYASPSSNASNRICCAPRAEHPMLLGHSGMIITKLS